jgi:hypothetical protein
MRLAAAVVLCGLSVSGARAVDLKPETVQAFERYIHETEKPIWTGAWLPGGGFLWVDEEPQRLAQVRQGQVAIENRSSRRHASRFPAD